MFKILVALLAITPTLTWASLPKDLDAKIRAFIQENQPVHETGVAVGIVYGDEVFLQGYGWRDRERKLPVTPDTLFGIGSTTKAFTATAMLMAEQNGYLHLEDPVQSALPEFATTIEQANPLFNSYDLLSHRSGLPRHDLAWYFNPGYARNELPGRIRHFSANPNEGMGFREGFQYNNLMYVTAGRILEARTGSSWEDFLRQNLLNPLGMERTNFSVNIAARDPNVALNYNKTLRIPPLNIDEFGPAGSINSSAREMVPWLKMLLRGGLLENGAALLSPDKFETLFSRQTPIRPSPGVEDLYYGLGWAVAKMPSFKMITHGGNVDGHSTDIAFFPERNLAIIVITNQNAAMMPILMRNFLMAQLLFAKPQNEAQSEQNLLSLFKLLPQSQFAFRTAPEEFNPLAALAKNLSRVTETTPVSKEKLELAALIGTYNHPGYGDLRVGRLAKPLEENIALEYYAMKKSILKAVSADSFSFMIHVQGEDHEGVPGKVEFDGAGAPIAILLPFISYETKDGGNTQDWVRFTRKN